MAVIFACHSAAGVAEEVGHVADEGGVVGVGVVGPFEEAETAAIRVVVTTGVGTGSPGLFDGVGSEDCDAAGAAVGVGGGDGLPEVGVGQHVFDCVVDKDGVELAVEAEGPHVALDVFERRVDGAADGQHVR